MKLVNHIPRMVNGEFVYDHFKVIVPVASIDGRYETCAICDSPLYPKCTEICAILKRDLRYDEEN